MPLSYFSGRRNFIKRKNFHAEKERKLHLGKEDVTLALDLLLIIRYILTSPDLRLGDGRGEEGRGDIF